MKIHNIQKKNWNKRKIYYHRNEWWMLSIFRWSELFETWIWLRQFMFGLSKIHLCRLETISSWNMMKLTSKNIKRNMNDKLDKYNGQFNLILHICSYLMEAYSLIYWISTAFARRVFQNDDDDAVCFNSVRQNMS